MYTLRRSPLYQHFLVNRELIEKLVRSFSVSPSDRVLEIGPGRGIITRALLNTGCRVIAVEIDSWYYRFLAAKFASPLLDAIHADFLAFPLPTQPYKVFSNPPFAITGQIVRKIFLSPNPPLDCCLVVQAEAAAKLILRAAGPNSMLAVLLYPWFETMIVHRFRPSDFSPPPQVDCVLLRLTRHPAPLVSRPQAYRDFVTHGFTHNRLAKFIPPARWLKLFSEASDPRVFRGSFARWQRQEQSLSKIHRSRTDKNWKRFL